MSDSDVFGKTVHDYYHDRLDGEVKHERDDGSVTDAHLDTYFSSYEEWSELEKKAVEKARGRVLDAGCGVGRHTLRLQETYEVWGVDSSRLAVKTAKERGVDKTVVGDIQRLGFEDSVFDSALVIGHQIGIGGTREDLLRNLEELGRVTEEGGIAVVDSLDQTAGDEEYVERNREKGRPEGYVKFRLVYGNEKTDWIELLRLKKKELEEVAEEVGWEMIETFGDNSYVAVLKKTD